MNHKINKILADSKERLKELLCINNTTNILKEGKSLDETLKNIALIVPEAWQFPEFTCARITYDEFEFDSSDFEETRWCMFQKFMTIDGKKGNIKVYYRKKFPIADEGPFLKEERDLILNLSHIIAGYINSLLGKEVLSRVTRQGPSDEGIKKYEIENHQLLNRFIGLHNRDRDVYHDLMPFKVKEILLVATLYDAYIIQKEGRFTESLRGEFYQLNLTSTPRITGVSTNDEAMECLNNKHFDLVILMIGLDEKNQLELCRNIKCEYPYIPIYLLLNNNRHMAIFKEKPHLLRFVDKHFVWNGDSRIFFTMRKFLEDQVNAENDTRVGMVRIILLVEDSSKYYSRYLPILYQAILEQTKRLVEEVTTDELYKILKLRGRPKVLLACTYEQAVSIYDKYRDNLFCVISDVTFPKKNNSCSTAGFELIEYIKKKDPNILRILQSSDPGNRKRANELESAFIDKNSDTLSKDIKVLLKDYLGFGSFVFRDKKGSQIAVARTLKEFGKLIQKVPDESLIYHGSRNHFSMWLMARGEIQIAKKIRSVKISDFDSSDILRHYMLETIKKYRNDQDRGRVIPIEKAAFHDETNIISLAPGALGGKGRGIAFITTLLHNFNLFKLIPGINISTPETFIIGTDEFDHFLEVNFLSDFVLKETDYHNIKISFLNGRLSENLIDNLQMLLENVTTPLAVRSSSLFEDSLMQPFSGIFDTYIIPNNHENINIRLSQLIEAVKLVYASIYSDHARKYFEAVNYKIEEEKMAIVIQSVVGSRYEDYYYPHISGTAQSHNYYPVSHMKPEEGFAVMAMGLGKYVVEGEKAFRFSPKYPQIEINSMKDVYKTSQVELIAVNLENRDNLKLFSGEDASLIRLDITRAKEHGTTNHCASIYDPENNRMTAGTKKYGPIVVNFANILKYDYIPLAKTISSLLDIIREALGSPAEIEFAVDLNAGKNNLPTFYLLQIKPLVGNNEDYSFDFEDENRENMILYSEKSMGNGKTMVYQDIIFIKRDKFDHLQTLKMAEEIDKINTQMVKEKKKYILIGPGRWGTRDPFIGIPVVWSQISNAGIIIETSLDNFPLDASLGSHFFHNLTSMNVGYFSVQHNSGTDFINWDLIESCESIKETEYFRHVRFASPLTVIMDGRKQRAAVIKQA
jgi:CheY-like chemotaxis protein